MIIKDYFSISELLQPLRNILAILVIISFAYFINSCNAEENKIIDPKIEETNVDTLIPLKLGNYWIYTQYSNLNDDGSGGTPFYLKSGFIIDGKMELNIYGKKITAYKLFPCMEDLDPGYDKPGTFKGSKLIYQGKEGVYFYGKEKFDSLLTSDNELIFTIKFGIGKEYRAHKFYYAAAGDMHLGFDELMTTYELISLDSLISTPAGEFKCVVYKMVVLDIYPLFRNDVFYFINSKIGIVAIKGMVYHYNKGTYKHTYIDLLTHYKIN
jgi:hypothetical protein